MPSLHPHAFLPPLAESVAVVRAWGGLNGSARGLAPAAACYTAPACC